MKTPNLKDVLLTKEGSISYVLSFEEEYEEAYNHFVGKCGFDQDEWESIKDCYWFCAKVEAKLPTGLVIGTAYLGGNAYASKAEVLGNGELDDILSGYAPQMVDEAKQEALAFLKDNDLIVTGLYEFIGM